MNNDINTIMEYYNRLYDKGLIPNINTLINISKKIRQLRGFNDDTDALAVCSLFKEISDIVDELEYTDLFVLWNTNRLFLVYEHNTTRDTTFNNELFLNYRAYYPIWMVYNHWKNKQLFVSRLTRPIVSQLDGMRITWHDFDVHTAYIRRTTKLLELKEKEND